MIFSKLRSYEERQPKTLDYWLSKHFHWKKQFQFSAFLPIASNTSPFISCSELDMLFLKLLLGIRFNDVVLKL